MSVAIASPGRSRALEGLAWVGLMCGLLLCAVAASRPPATVAYAAFGPHDLTAWAEAICGAVGALTAAVNGLAIAWHRWGRPSKKPRHRDTPPPGPAPHTGTRGGA